MKRQKQQCISLILLPPPQILSLKPMGSNYRYKSLKNNHKYILYYYKLYYIFKEVKQFLTTAGNYIF